MSDSTSKEPEVLEGDEPVYFHFSASLRIFGDGLDIDEISRKLGLTPTHSIAKGKSEAIVHRRGRTICGAMSRR